MSRLDVLICLFLVALLGCGSDRLRNHEEPEPIPPRCGDGVRNGEEACEGADLGAASCRSLGYAGGVLACAADCGFDATGCSRTCGNGRVELGDECDGSDLGTAICGAWGAFRCDAACRLDRSGCVEVPFEALQSLEWLKPALASFAPRASGGMLTTELLVAQPDAHRIDLLRYDADKGFLVGAGQRTVALDEERTALAPLAVDLSQDGSADLVLGYAGQGTLTVKLSSATGYSTVFVGVGCSPGDLMAGDFDGDGDRDVLVACAAASGGLDAVVVVRNDGATLQPLPALRFPQPATWVRVGPGARPDLLARSASGALVAFRNAGASGFDASGVVLSEGPIAAEAVAADFNGDGRIDVAAADGAGAVALVLATDSGFEARSVLDGVTGPRLLRAVDFDLDGWTDLALVDDGDVLLVRSPGAGGTPRVERFAHAMQPRSLEFGDADRDGDLDLVVAGSAPGGGGKVLVLRNRVR